MAFLLVADLKATFYKKAANMDEDDLNTYLARANAFAKGEIGGIPPTVDDDLKAAVAMAFEIMSQGESSQTDDLTGNITEGAPPGPYARAKQIDPLDTVKAMLRPYRLEFEASCVSKSDHSIAFL